jgi:uncharacterized OsmC-like protein/alpha-beta hydrolase superfamily lysophospholipase
MNRNRGLIQFPGAQGKLLAAQLDLPPHAPRAYALFAHCFTCSKETLAAARICAALTRYGIAVLRFDFTGLGGSAGDFANTNFSSNIADLLAATDWLRAHHRAPHILIGHSLGGAAVLAAAGDVPEAVAVATIGAPHDPSHVARLFAPARQEITAAGEAQVNLAGRTFRITRQFLDDLANHADDAHIAGLGKALLIFHSPRDTVVDIDNAARIFRAARHPKSFVSLDTADHLLTRKEDAQYVAGVLAAWASRYIAPEPQLSMDDAPVQVIVSSADEGPFAQDIRIGKHRLRADEPLSVGGQGSGPTPYDLLVAGLGACTAMTLRMYAAHKQWPLEDVTVRLNHQKIYTQDCDDCESRNSRIDRIEREIELAGDLDATQRARLLEIAGKCPVHRTLQTKVVIETALRKPAS